MKATIRNRVLAEAPNEETITIEGNVYFPPAAVTNDILTRSETQYTCPWKGHSQYFDAIIDDNQMHDIAWSYPELRARAIDIVGRDFSGYVAFGSGVTVDDN